MMGRGADCGCGTEEKPCPVSRLTPAASIPAPASSPGKLEVNNLGVDLYTQALKALSERSPFDSDVVLATSVSTLPSGLASLLSKVSESRKKHKRPHSDAKSSRKCSAEKLNIWVELEDYFRGLTLQDIEMLCRLSSSFGFSASSKSCFTIPVLGNAPVNYRKIENENVQDVPVVVSKVEEATCADVPSLDSAAVEVEDNNGEIEQHMEIDEESRDSLAVIEQSLLPESSSQSCSCLEWVLVSRNRFLLTTMRPTKKRKLVGETAGLERLNVAQPCEGSSSLCHVCSMGEAVDQLNQIVVCKSCHVVVHQKCYGVQGEIDESWVCSWCKHNFDGKAGGVSSSDRPCVLCSKPSGALKRFQRAGGNGESVEFAHLFCSLWMPEIYIDDTRLMEPLLCLGGIKDVRGKLMCSLCKVKHGFCVRCSDGSCRTAFHPICAREAGNKLEIWGKFGCDDIELHVFCSKHSRNVGASMKSEQNQGAASDPRTTFQPAVLSVNKIKKLKIGCKNGDKVTFHLGAAESISNQLGEAEPQEMALKDGHELTLAGNFRRDLGEDVKTSCRLDLVLILKKLMDRGKMSLEQLASDISISADSLASKLTDNHLGPELYCKLLKWLKDHTYMDTYEKDSRAKVRFLGPLKDELRTVDSSDAVAIRNMDISDVPVKSVPPRRRTVGNIRILKEEKVSSVWNDKLVGNGVSTEGPELKCVSEDHDHPNKDSNVDRMAKNMAETIGFEDLLENSSPISEGALLKSNSLCNTEFYGPEERTSSGKSSLLDLEQDLPSCSSIDTVICPDGNIEPGKDSFVHPYIQKKLEEVQSWLNLKVPPELIGSDESNISSEEQSSNFDDYCNDKDLSVYFGDGERSNGVNLDSLLKAKQMGYLDLFPEDELEGEIIYFQRRLLANAVEQKHRTDQLVCKIVRNLPHEMDAVRKQKWDDVLVNQYIYELKEARKQGRKERRHREAQAVLAAATAAAAASPRISSLRKDPIDESLLHENQVKVESSRVRGGTSSQSEPRASGVKPSFAIPKSVPDRYSDLFQFTSGPPNEHLRSCDICRRPESLLNPILVCSSCKVAVHLNCYRSIKESKGPWYCELCEESSLSKSLSAPVVNDSEKPPRAECGLCGGSSGAFRKTTNGEWIHAFCAEWVFDSTFKRGQMYPCEGMETVIKGKDNCSVCHRRYGVCIKCNYGNCQSTFHPSCARAAGYYMHARSIGGGRVHHKAYCSKHSLEQRAKAEAQKHAAEDLKIAKQHRVELEKLRLLCERIVKREKLKRELLLCNHSILASKQDSVAASILVRRPYLSRDVSSESATTSLRAHESATTSLKGHEDDSRSFSEAMEKADDLTVDSALSVKQCIRLPLSIDNDRKTDDSTTSQHCPTPKASNRVSFAGKQIPRAALACRNFPPNGEKMLRTGKNTETFEKELVMTSDQASMKNRRLPKGYIYVPIDCLSNGKQVNRGSVEREELDR